MALKLSLKSSLFLLSLVTSLVQADILNVAVASNFTYTLRLLAQDFKSRTGHQLRISSASTGKLYTQIKNGAPFDIFMAADEDRPDRLITEGD
ncbi:MAG: molybdate transport system substrate-binding protein, partial [Gammaproteobacteria bacterium]